MARIDRELELNRPMSFQRRGFRNSLANVKWLDQPNALYPARDFTKLAASGLRVYKFVKGNGLWACGRDADDDLVIYDVLNYTGTMSVNKRAFDASNTFADAAYYYDGAGDFLYGIDSDGDIWKFNTSSYAYSSVSTTPSGTGDQLVAYHPENDKLYYITQYKIWNQTAATFNTTSIKDLPQNFTMLSMFPYKSWMVLIGRNNGTGEMTAFFYDVITEPSTFDKTIIITSGSNLITAGVVDGQLSAVIAEPDKRDTTQLNYNLGFYIFNGSSFQEVSRVTTTDLSFTDGFGFSDSGYIYSGIVDAGGVSGIFRFSSDGEIKIIAADDDVDSGPGLYEAGIIIDGILVVALRDESSTRYLGYINANSTFADKSIYESPILEDAFTTKQLEHLWLTFETTSDIGSGEIGKIYYRQKPYDSWTLLLTYDYDVDGVANRHEIVYNNTNQLPQFKEIQFRLESTQGLRITGAGYGFTTINDSRG